MAVINIGLDDTDSNEYGMCTTYLGAIIRDRLRRHGFKESRSPRLIRLNPSCPYKTRGNGAIHLSFEANGTSELEQLEKLTERLVREYSALKDPATDPGIVYLLEQQREEQKSVLAEFYRRAVTSVVSLSEALSVLARIGGKAVWFREGKGVIGALAAIAAPESSETTYELLVYRDFSEHRPSRLVSENSVRVADLETWPGTYDNYDWFSREVLITPHTPCPVLLGIRGIDVKSILEAFRTLRISDIIKATALYSTNQGSGDHVVHASRISEIKEYSTVTIKLEICSRPETGTGGHVFIWGCDSAGSKIRLAAYEPTKHFRKILLGLQPGDKVEATGSYVPRAGQPMTLNLEMIKVLELKENIVKAAPRCPICGSKMQSLGKDKGYRCKKCGYIDRRARPVDRRKARRLTTGLYWAPPRAHRHLTRPPEARLFWG